MSEESACRGRSGQSTRRRVPGRTQTGPARAFIPAATPPSLAALQDLFQRAVVDGDDRVLALLADSSRETRETLLGVYRHAYRARLVEILRNDYTEFAHIAGEETFEALALGYIANHPSRVANARWFGAAFPGLLAAHAEHAAHPERADVASFTRALNDAFDADDASRLTLADLATVPVGDWGGLVFTPHPCVRRLDLTTNAIDLWQWASEGATGTCPKAAARSEPERLVIYRPDLTPRYRRLSYEEAMLLDEVFEGTAFSGLCEMASTYGGEDGAALRAAAHLKVWIEDGMLEGPERT